MVDGIVSLLIMGILIFGFALAYKKRVAIAKWLEDSDMASSYDPKTQRMNLEHKVAVAQRKLEIMDEIAGKNNKQQNEY
jgi:hypothetical protein